MPSSETTESSLAGANEPNLGNFMVSKRQGYGLSHKSRGVARHSLVQHQADRYPISHAALLSAALSSRLAAANCNACWTSSGSNSG